jgi:hypothetical protein
MKAITDDTNFSKTLDTKYDKKPFPLSPRVGEKIIKVHMSNLGAYYTYHLEDGDPKG